MQVIPTLRAISSLTHTPGISSVVPLLIEVITSPDGDNTAKALVIPIFTNIMTNRTSMTTKMASQVIGGICKFIASPRSILQCVSQLVDGIQSILCNPIPQVCATNVIELKLLNLSLPEEALTVIFD